MSWEDVAREPGAQSSEKTQYTKFEAGTTLIRVLDNEPYSFWSHWLNTQKTSVTCPGRDCPICSVIAQQKANQMEATYTSSHRHAIRIWNYQTNRMEIMIQGKQFFSNLLMLHKEVGDITTYDIKVVRSGEGKNTTYSMIPTAPADFTVTEGIEKIDMAEMLKAPTREEMLMLMEGKTWTEINGTKENAA